MNALSLMIEKLWSMLKFFKSRSKVAVKVTFSKFMVPSERHCDEKHLCQIWKPCHWAQIFYGQCWSFFKSRSMVKVKVTCSKIMVPSGRSCHKEYSCQIQIPISEGKKVIHNVKVCWRTDGRTDRQTDRQTDRVITIGHPPSGGALIISANNTNEVLLDRT